MNKFAGGGEPMRLRLTVVGFFFALMFIYVGANSYFGISYLNAASDPGWQIGLDGRLQTYSSLSSAYVTPLRDGDEIVALDGQEFKYSRQYFKTFARIPPGSSYIITVRRDRQVQQLTLRTAPFPLWVRINGILLQLVIPVISLLVGLTVFLLRPTDERALLLALMLGMFWAAWTPFSLLLTDSSWWLAVLVAAYLVGSLFAAVIFHFFLVFPERSTLLRRFPRLAFYLYLPFLLTAYPFIAISTFRIATDLGRFYEVVKEFPILFFINLIAVAIYLSSGLLLLIVNYRKANQLSRRKLRVVLAGTLAGFLPFLSVNAAFFILKPSFTTLWFAIISASHLILLLIPIAFAYAILRHQVIPVSLVIRRGVQYLLAKNALRTLIALPVISILWVLAANSQRTLTEILFRNSILFYLSLLAAITLGLVFRKRLSAWIDRKFFREAYNQEKILHNLLDDVLRLDSIPEMSRRVTEEVERALHLQSSYLFYRTGEKRELSLSFTSGGASKELRIPEEFQLLSYMELQGAAQDFPFSHKNNLPQSEKLWLDELDTRLIVPMCGTDGRLAGLFLLGDKKSEVPYTATDRALLEAIAGQVVLVYENVRLKERAARDRRIEREVLARIEGRNINLLKECPQCGACYDAKDSRCEKDDTELTVSLPVERTIDERYRLDRLIGKGGMGAVYEARDLRLNRAVAVKILTGSMFGNDAALRRFEREAQASARLSHPNIIHVHDYGTLETEGAYLVMELARGETLGARLKREKRLSPQTAADIFAQVLSGIAAAHDAGIVHRDLKPENILLSPNADNGVTARILDFGLAKAMQPDLSANAPTEVTTPGTVMGTFGYMSPEQLTGGDVDHRSDLFSIGAMVVECVTGRLPFTGRTYHELLTNIIQMPFHLEDYSPHAERLDAVLQKCLAKDRTARFASAAEMQRELIVALRACASLRPANGEVKSEADTFIMHKAIST